MRWLAEAIRLRESSSGRLDDAEAVAAARAAGGDAETRILARALALGRRDGTDQALESWRWRARVALGVLSGLALASGFGAALTVLGDGTRPVNVIWALGALLGVHLISLLLWSVSISLDGRHAGSALGRGWLWISARFVRDTGGAHVSRALGMLHARGGLARWWLGAVSHGLWLAALAGVLAGLLFAFSVRGYGFLWETTILPAAFFVRFVELVGWLPAQVGFAVPDPESVRASGAAALTHEAGRKAWSSWLLGCVVVYGVVPRLLLWAMCLGLVRQGRARLALDLGLPYYAALVARLAPQSERIGVTDAAPEWRRRAHVERAHAVGSHAAVLVGLELRGDLPWPPARAGGVRVAGRVDGRAQRRETLQQLAGEPPARLLVACDPRLTPDRGSLEWIAEISTLAGECRVWLMMPERLADPDRLNHWREGLAEIGLAPEAVFEDEAGAIGWLEYGHG